MIIYDGCFSFTTVSFRALLVDIASSSKDRERCNMYAAIFHVVGSFGVFFASLLFESAYTNAGNGNAHVNSVDVLSSRATSSDPIGVIDGGADADLTYFRIFCYSWAVLAGICFVLSSRAKGHKEVTLKRSGVCNQDQKMNFLYFLRETIKRPSMVAALIVWFVQDYSCTFATNFFGIFLAFVAAPYISPLGRSFVLLASFIVPHFITVAITPFLQTLGKKKIVSWMFGLRAIVGVGFGMMCMYFLSIVDEFRYHKDNSNNNPHKEDASGFSYIHNDEGGISVVSRNSALLFTLLLFLNRILTEGVCRLQSLILSDICDEDTVTFHRKLSMSGAIHGLVALVSKPSQSLAPVLSCIYLAHKGVLLPGDLKVGGDKDTATRIDNMTVSFNLVYTLCWLLFLTIILTTLSMLFVWKYLYKLEGSYLIEIRAVIRSREMLNDVEEGNDDSNSALARRKNDGASEDFLISQFQGTPGDGVHLHQRRSNSKSVYSLNSK